MSEATTSFEVIGSVTEYGFIGTGLRVAVTEDGRHVALVRAAEGASAATIMHGPFDMDVIRRCAENILAGHPRAVTWPQAPMALALGVASFFLLAERAARDQASSMGEEQRRKRARDASPEENAVPGTRGPAQEEATCLMKGMLDTFRECLPGWNFALFVIEPEERARAAGRLPRFNYGSTVDLADMVALLEGFIARQKEHAKIEQAMAGEAKGHG